MRTNTIQPAFSIRRLSRLLYNRLLEDLPAIGIVAATIFGLNLTSMIFFKVPFFNTPSQGFGHYSWGSTLIICGILLAGNAFSKMHDGRSGPEWILLPASNEEKYLSAILNYLVLYPILAGILSMLLSAVLYLLSALFGIDGGIIWTPLHIFSTQTLKVYLVLSLFAMAGSARFRKFALGKTAAVMVASLIIASLLLMFMMLISNEEGRKIVFGHGSKVISALDLHIEQDSAQYKGLMFIKEFLYWISTAFAFVYGYFLVREKESRDEVQ